MEKRKNSWSKEISIYKGPELYKYLMCSWKSKWLECRGDRHTILKWNRKIQLTLLWKIFKVLLKVCEIHLLSNLENNLTKSTYQKHNSADNLKDEVVLRRENTLNIEWLLRSWVFLTLLSVLQALFLTWRHRVLLHLILRYFQ